MAHVSMLATAYADVAASVVPDGNGSEVGLTRIECVAADGLYWNKLRGAIIDTGRADPTQDVILTVAHGLPSDVDALRRRCSVVGAEDERYQIVSVWRPSPRGRGSVDDWAVLLTERRLHDAVARVPALTIDHASRRRMVEGGIPVRLPLRFVGAERACRLTRMEWPGTDLGVEFFGHTCRAWSGHSGSPILASVEGEMYILGIHLGSQWIFEKQASLEIGRYLDVNILEAIHAAAERGQRVRSE